MEGWKGGRVEGRKDGRTEGVKDGRAEGWEDGLKDLQIKVWKEESMEG